MRVIYEDRAIIVVEKAAGEIVHPAPGYETGTMCDKLKAQYPEIAAVGSRERPGVVHRLDRETSGVMVFARTQGAYVALRKAFESHAGVEKEYLAVCHGSPKRPSGTLDGPVGRERLRAITHWNVLGRRAGVSLVDFTIETGRTHQIRIHAAEMGCPIVGDREHGSRERDARMRVKPRRTLLHAVRLAFVHPVGGERVEFVSEPPPDIVHAV